MSADYSFLNEAGTDKSSLIKGLQLVQQKEGYVSDEAIEAVAAHFGMAPAEVEGVLTFYAQFKRVKPGRFQISVCDGTACHIKGSPQIQQWLTAELGIKDGAWSAAGSTATTTTPTRPKSAIATRPCSTSSTTRRTDYVHE